MTFVILNVQPYNEVMEKASRLALITLLFSFAVNVNAANAPLSVNFLPPIQYPSDDYAIKGLRVSALWGNQSSAAGLDLGVVGNVTQTKFSGAALSGGFNLNYGEANVYLFQVAGLANLNLGTTNIYGVQASLGVNYSAADTSVHGLAIAPLNIGTNTKVYGFQVGLYNRADTVYGFQIGFINVTKNLHGMQIGFLNFNETGFFQISPIINIGF